MNNKLRLEIDPPEHGWAVVRLNAPGVSLELNASYTPRDSITDLAGAASALQAGLPAEIVSWNTEPIEFDFEFERSGDQIRLEIRKYRDHSRSRRSKGGELVAVVESDVETVVNAIWRGLRRLQGHMTGSDFATAWGHDFPTSSVDGMSAKRQTNS